MGMSIDEAIRRIDEHNYIHQQKEPRAVYITEAFDTLIGVVKKYQKIEQIVEHWACCGNPSDSMIAISEVIEDGKDT